VAGEAKKMAPIMHKFVNGAAMDEGSSSLLSAYKVEGEQHEKPAKNRPGQQLAHRDDGKGYGLNDSADDGLSHVETSWDRASQSSDSLRRRSDLRQMLLSLQWRDRAGFAPASSFRLQKLI
jgi:hypothetical protein